jgi:alpha-1,2-mannosyltransferase
MLLRNFVVSIGLLLAVVMQYFLVIPMVRAVPIDYAQFYFAGQLVAKGQVSQIYDTTAYEPLADAVRAEGRKVSIAHYFNRPAFAALLCYPLSFVSYQTGSNILVGLNFLLWAFLVWKLPIWLGAPAHVRLWLLSYLPFGLSVALTQDTLLITIVVVYSCWILMPRNQAAAGCLLALCLVKPHLILLLPLLFLLERKWVALKWFLGTGTLLGLLSVALVGMGGIRQWLVLLGAPTTDIYASTMGNLRALGMHFGLPMAVSVGIVAAVAGLAIIRYGSYLDRLAVLPLLALLFSPHTYWQDFSLASIFALISPDPITRYAILLPWAFFWPTFDIWPMTLALCACLAARGYRLWDLQRRESFASQISLSPHAR